MIVATHGIIGSQITQFVGLLDAYPNAAAAYSLRLLRSAYTGSAIRVRISTTGNPEYNIGFVNGQLDIATLEGYCTGGLNAFVKTWYDQSGNARNATQETAANQPQIVSSGSVILENGKPSVRFGVNRLILGDLSFLTQGELFLITKSLNTDNGFIDFGAGVSNNHYPYLDGKIYDGFGSDFRKSLGSPVTPINILHTYGVTTESNLWQSRINGSLQFETTSNNVAFNTNCIIGQPDYNYQGLISELILYPFNQSSNRGAIQLDISTFFSI